jgi:hypothetical protein
MATARTQAMVQTHADWRIAALVAFAKACEIITVDEAPTLVVDAFGKRDMCTCGLILSRPN